MEGSYPNATIHKNMNVKLIPLWIPIVLDRLAVAEQVQAQRSCTKRSVTLPPFERKPW
jgi:hypothetical protein